MNKPSRGRPSLRKQLIEAAGELLRDEGPSALTARAVARRAGVAEATVFNNFGDLRGLLVAVGREAIPEYDELMDSINSGPGASVTDWLIEVFKLNRLYILAALPLSAQQMMIKTPQQKADDILVNATQRAICSQFEMLVSAGKLKKDLDISAAAMLLMSGSGFCALCEITTGLVSPVTEDPAELARRMVAQMDLV